MHHGTGQDESTPCLALLDAPALEIICAVVRRSLFHRFRGVPPDAINDAVQEAACKLYEQREMRSEVNPRTVYSWIHTTASRELGHALKRLGRIKGVAEVAVAGTVSLRTTPGVNGNGTSSEDSGEYLNDLLTYDALLGHLSNSLASAVQLHFEGYTAEEIAGLLGCSRAAAYKRVQRGCVELRELWQKEEGRVRELIA